VRWPNCRVDAPAPGLGPLSVRGCCRSEASSTRPPAVKLIRRTTLRMSDKPMAVSPAGRLHEVPLHNRRSIRLFFLLSSRKHHNIPVQCLPADLKQYIWVKHNIKPHHSMTNLIIIIIIIHILITTSIYTLSVFIFLLSPCAITTGLAQRHCKRSNSCPKTDLAFLKQSHCYTSQAKKLPN
jgi:hypothetical protein